MNCVNCKNRENRLSNVRSYGFSDCAPCCHISGDAPDEAYADAPVVDMEELVKEIHVATNIPVSVIERVLEEENNILYKMGIIYEL